MEHLIVPYDFESTGKRALAVANTLNTGNKPKITLLHIAKDAAELKQAEKQFDELKETQPEELETKVVIGNLVNDLSREAAKAKGSAIVMAIRQESGLQKVFGSRAVRVITDSKIPFLIIQDRESESRISKIALTIDSNEESIQILSAAVMFCEDLGAEIVLVGGENTDADKKKKIAANMEKMSAQLKTNNIRHETVYLPTNNFEGELLRYASAQGVDLLAVTYYENNSTLFSSGFVQHLLENSAGIPVLTIGGREVPAFQKVFNNMVCPVSIEKVDSNISRTTIFMNVILMAVFLATYNPVFAYIVAADYFVRAFISGKYSPLRFIAEKMVKALNLKAKPINLAPKVFASRLGFLCAAAGVIFFHTGSYWGAVISVGMLAVLSFMDSVLNFCMGCVIYNYLVYPLFKNKVR